MADSPRVYNGLGQILSAGAEQTLALGLSLGRTSASMRTQLERKFGAIPNGDYEQLEGMAKAAIDAGEYINSINPSDLPSTDRIPINDRLFGNEPTGDRFCYESEWTDPITGEKKLFKLNSPVPLTLAQIADAASKSASYNKEHYPDKWGEVDPTAVNAETLRMLFANRCH